MASKKDEPEEPRAPKPSPSAPGEIPLEPAGEAEVSHQEEAPRPSEPKHIHPRRPLPRIPEAKPERDDEPDPGRSD